MTIQEKLEALKVGDLDKILPFHRILEGKVPYKREDTANAARVEVTKAVVDEVISQLNHEEISYGPSDYTRNALSLLKQLKESLTK
jgi:hypothetical protein